MAEVAKEAGHCRPAVAAAAAALAAAACQAAARQAPPALYPHYFGSRPSLHCHPQRLHHAARAIRHQRASSAPSAHAACAQGRQARPLSQGTALTQLIAPTLPATARPAGCCVRRCASRQSEHALMLFSVAPIPGDPRASAAPCQFRACPPVLHTMHYIRPASHSAGEQILLNVKPQARLARARSACALLTGPTPHSTRTACASRACAGPESHAPSLPPAPRPPTARDTRPACAAAWLPSAPPARGSAPPCGAAGATTPRHA